jgi:hypothetical protein
MHNDTPLGTFMHLKELDRQAARRSRSLRPASQGRWRAAALGIAAIALLRRLYPAGGWSKGRARSDTSCQYLTRGAD